MTHYTPLHTTTVDCLLQTDLEKHRIMGNPQQITMVTLTTHIMYAVHFIYLPIILLNVLLLNRIKL